MPHSHPFWHSMMPYKFEKIENPIVKNVYLPVNRWYKPLGISDREYVDYHLFIRQALVFAREITDADQYLYDDGSCRDFMAYLIKLEKFMKRKHWVIDQRHTGMSHKKSMELMGWADAKKT